MAVLAHQTGAFGHADQGAGVVEQVDEQEGEDHADQAHVEGAGDVQLQEGRGQRRWHRDHPAERRDAQRDRGHGHRQDTDQHGAANLQRLEGDDQEEAQGGEDRRGFAEVAQTHQGGWVIDDDAGVMQGNQRQEQADAGSNGRAQRQRDAVHDPFADAEDRQQEEQHRGEEHRAQRHLPGVAHVQDHGVGEEGVQAHARRQGDRVVGDDAHGHRADGRGQAGGDEERALVHAGLAEDARVDEQDVGHGQEGGDARENLGAHVGVVCF